MATGLNYGARGYCRSVSCARRIVRAPDFPATDGDRRSGEIVKLDEFVGCAIRPAHAKLADYNVCRNSLDTRGETQKENKCEKCDYNDRRSSEHTGSRGGVKGTNQTHTMFLLQLLRFTNSNVI